MEDQGRMMPPGYRFYPTEEELIGFYLREKLQGRRNNQLERVIPVLDIYQHKPWDLPKLSGAECRQDPQVEEWFFFMPRQEKEAKGGRPNRLTAIGYWKATGSPGYIYSSDNRIIGEKRTMVFYKGRAPGSKTDWKMNEYRAIDNGDSAPLIRLEFSLCRVYTQSKCMRSFDRRPSSFAPGAIQRTSSTSVAVDHHHPGQQPITISSIHQQNPLLPMMMTDTTVNSRENYDQNTSNEDVHHLDDHHTSGRPYHDDSSLGIVDMNDASWAELARSLGY